MAGSEPIITVILFSAISAGAAGLGVLPFIFARRVPQRTIGAAYALASGLMLGLGYLLLSEGISRDVPTATLGFGIGALYTFWSQHYAGLAELDLGPSSSNSPGEGYKVILQDTLHSASEGVAIGVCMFVNLEFGIFTAFSLAVHNVGEAMALTAILRGRNVRIREAAGLCIATNVTQVLMAIVAFAVSPALGPAFPLALGFAAGGLVFLIMTESLPASYQRADGTLIGFLVSFAAGAVLLLEQVFS